MNLKDLHAMGEKLFGARSSLVNTWQEIGERFHPTRATFTVDGTSERFGDTEMTSYPMLVRRNLGDAFSTMLRPTEKEWFHVQVEDDDFKGDNETKRWLEYHTTFLRKVMYKPRAQFTRATKTADHDFATFGQAALEVRLLPDQSGLFYQSHHLRDVAWAQNAEGQPCPIVRKWKVSAHTLIERFGDHVHPDVKKKHATDPFCEIECRHMVIESSMWDGQEGARTPYVSIYYDVAHNLHPMEVSGTWTKLYTIPRWALEETAYAHSPATWIALPEVRLIQAMQHTLLEAGEKAVNPPMVARKDVFRDDMAIYAGALMFADLGEGEKLEESLRLLINDKSGIPLGLDMIRDSRQLIAEIMFTSKLSMPPPTKDMTAYEVAHRVEEWIRGALPLFEPVENDYNASLVDMSFETVFGPRLRMEARGITTDMQIPRKLRGAELTYGFESPLHDAIEKQKGNQLLQAKQLIAAVMDVDQSVAAMVDAKTALRDTLEATIPAKWLRSESQVEDMENQMRRDQQMQQMLGAAQQSADVVQKLGSVAPALAEAI